MPLKIIYIHQYFNTPLMSGGTRSFEMARRLVEMGHEVHIITSWRDGGRGARWGLTNEHGIYVHWFPVGYSNHMGYIQRIMAFIKFAIASSYKSSSISGDIIFATSTPLTIAIPAIYASKTRRVPMVFEVRDLWPELPIAIGALKNPLLKFIAKLLERLAYKNSEAVVALSPGMSKGVVATGYSPKRVSIIPNSCDIDFFCDIRSEEVDQFRNKRSWLGKRKLLVYAGAFGRMNGVGYIVDIAKELLTIDPEIRILLIGGGQEYDLVKHKAEREGLLGINLFIEPRVSKEEMPVVLAAADMASSLFIDLPEMRSNSSNKFFDTLAAKKPIFINFGGWMAELVETSGCGLVGWNKSHTTVAMEISKFLSNVDQLKKAGEQSSKLARDLFDRNLLAEQLEKVLVLASEKKGEETSTVTQRLVDR